MKTHFITVICLVAVLLAGCGPAATPTPPPTAAPTNTPAPTSTPIPTDTPVPTATFTATPDVAATEAAEAEAAAAALEAAVKAELDALGVPTDTGSLGWLQLEPVAIDTDGGAQNIADLFDPTFSAGDFAIMSDITWDTTGIITCGLLLRAEPTAPNGDYYRFEVLRLSGAPAWGISYAHDGVGQFMLGGDIHYSDAVDQTNGATNKVVITSIGNEFNVYINGVRQSRMFDDSSKLSEGRIGYALWQESGRTTCTFENTAVWVYE